jgi:hypothetical protein
MGMFVGNLWEAGNPVGTWDRLLSRMGTRWYSCGNAPELRWECLRNSGNLVGLWDRWERSGNCAK